MSESMSCVARDYFADYRKYKPRNPEDRSEEEDITGKIVIVTGCNTGLGKATVIELAKRGARIIMACRASNKTQEAFLDIKNLCPNANIEVIELDLGNLESVRKFANTVKEKYSHIDILINNGGISNPTGIVEKTVDGFESHMGVNHLGHFLLTLLLLDLLKKGAPSRIVIVASTAHQFANLDLDDINLDKVKSWGPGNWLAYGNSKLANMLFARELSKRLAGTGVTTYALCPGIVKTDIARNNRGWFKECMQAIYYKLVGLTPAEGCQTTVVCATYKSLAKESGQMYRFEKKWDKASEALDEELGLRLWSLSEALVGLNSADKLEKTTTRTETANDVFL